MLDAFLPPNRPTSVQRTANLLFVILMGSGAFVVTLLMIVTAMFAETLLPHILEFCIMAWQALTVETAYRAMLVGLLVLVGTTVTFAMRAWQNARRTQRQVNQLLAQSIPLSSDLTGLAAALGIGARLDVVEFARPLSFCYGWRRPRILITSGLIELMTPDELAAVLAHEKYHLRNGDPLKILLLRALRDAVVFLPVLRDLTQNYFAAQEIAADEDVTQSPEARQSLARALYKMVRYAEDERLSVSAFTPLSARVQQLANPQRPFMPQISWRRLLVSVVCAVALLIAVFHPTAPMLLGHALSANCHSHVGLDVLMLYRFIA
ncbi:MAG TPA: M56 family metallopeptidase [Anaerolineae bacterium]|nr:M56 family metallopeptidase [Anaerolineae bacterium]